MHRYVLLGAGSTRRLRRWLAWVELRRLDRLFQQLDRRQRPVGPISRRGVVAIIRKRLEAAGITGFFGSQSLRIGAAESMAEAGATIEEIQRAARWRSWTTAAPYVRRARARRGAEARKRYRHS